MNYKNIAMDIVGIGTGLTLLVSAACTSTPLVTPSATSTPPAQTQTLETKLYGKVDYSLQQVQTSQGNIETYVASMSSPDGKNMWSTPLDMSVAINYASDVTGGSIKAEARDFNFKHLATLQNVNAKGQTIDAVVIGLNHKDYYPATASILDAKTGKEIGQVFSPGHITGVAYASGVEIDHFGKRDVYIFTAFSGIAGILEETNEVIENAAKLNNTEPNGVPFLPAAMVVDANTFQVLSYKLFSLQAGEAYEPKAEGNQFSYKLSIKGVAGVTQNKIGINDLVSPEAILLAKEYNAELSLSPKKTSSRIGSSADYLANNSWSNRELRNRSRADMQRRIVSMKATARM